MDDARVREGLEQFVEVLEMERGLAEPAPGALPEQELDGFSILLIKPRTWC
jgi:hypothetical protein